MYVIFYMSFIVCQHAFGQLQSVIQVALYSLVLMKKTLPFMIYRHLGIIFFRSINKFVNISEKLQKS
jgi:hypothetical protein